MKTIKAYKGFDEGLKCRDFQYEEGKEYKIDEKPIRCGDKGFHACDNPLDILDYYDLCDSEFAEVEALGDIDRTGANDTKFATNHIKIKTKINLAVFIKASIDFVFAKSKIKNSNHASSGYGSKHASSGGGSNHASSGYGSKHASSGDYSQHASSGDHSQHASSGYRSQHASSGNGSKHASSGYGSKHAASGDYSQHASSGDGSKHASSGDGSKHVSSGDHSKHASSGYGSKHEINGPKSIAMACGRNSLMKGKIGNWIVLAEYDDEGNNVIAVVSGKIDGKKIKEDVWYMAKNGEFKEA